MKYYSLGHEFTKEAIGPYPQSKGMVDNYPYKRSDSIWNLDYDNHFTPNLDAIQLSSAAILTDLLSVTTITPIAGKIISGQFKNLLDNFNLPPHCFFQAKVIDNKKREVLKKQYYLFRVLEYQNQFINFDKSDFYIHRLAQGEVGNIHISKSDDLEYSSKERGLGPTEVIKPRFITLFPEIHFDIFSFRRFAGFFVSERLKTAIEENGLTGIRFEAADYILQKEVLSFKE